MVVSTTGRQTVTHRVVKTVSKTCLQVGTVWTSFTVSNFVFITVLEYAGTSSTLVRVRITVHGTISVTSSYAGSGAGAGASTHGVCLQMWHASAVSPASEAARIAAGSHHGRTPMALSPG